MSEKIASRWSDFLRTAPVEELAPTLNRVIGSAPSTYYKDSRLNNALKAVRGGKNPNREELVLAMRTRLGKGFPKPILEKTGPEHVDRDVLRTFKDRLKSPLQTVEHEGVLEELEPAVVHGPNSSAGGVVPGFAGRMDPAGMFVHRVGDPLEASRAGAYAARRASYAGGAPARLTFQVPSGLLQEHGRIGGGEYVVPASVWRYTTGHELKKLGFKLQGQTSFQGLPVAIENRKGSVRSGVDRDGKPWRTVMQIPYGYIKGSKGADNEAIDTYVGPHKDATHAFVVHQHKHTGKGYDEDKVLLGFRNLKEAVKAYLQHYNTKKFLGPVKSVPMERLKELLSSKKKLVKISSLRQEMWAGFFDELAHINERG